MKILQVSHGFPPKENAGVELYTFDLSKALTQVGHDVSVFCRGEDPDREEFSSYEEGVEGLRVRRVINRLTRIDGPRSLYDNPFMDSVFLQTLEEVRPDLVHFQHLFGLSGHLVRMAKEEGYPVVMTLHDFFMLCHRIQLLRKGGDLCQGPIYGLECVSCLDAGTPRDIRTRMFLRSKDLLPFPILKWTKRFFIPPQYLEQRGYEAFHRYRYVYEVFKACDLLLTPSYFVKNFFARYYRSMESKMKVLPLGLPPFTRQRRPSKSEGKVRFCYFGTILPHKGLDVLVDAFKTLPKGSAVLTVFGSRTPWNQDYFDRLKQQALGLEVHFRGAYQREELPDALSDQDVAVLPSIWPETFSIVIREAYLLGLPVVASRIGAIPEAVNEGVSGLLFKPGDKEDLKRCLLRFIEDPGLLEKMAPGPSLVKPMAAHALELEEIYEGLLRKGKGRSFNYSDYASHMMEREIIRAQHQPRVRYFKDCQRVLDLACGSGFFLELLKEAGIEALGVDRNEAIVKKVRQKQLKAVHSDIFHYLETVEEGHDGIFCSHLLEHLPFDQVVRLIELIHRRLDPGGVLVFVYPNPESIRLHLFGFWRDPEHVRFYAGGLIQSVCHHYGLHTEYSNEQETPLLLEAPYLEPLSRLPAEQGAGGTLSEPNERMERVLQEFNQRIEAFNRRMHPFSDAVNRMWAKPDEGVLVFRK